MNYWLVSVNLRTNCSINLELGVEDQLVPKVLLDVMVPLVHME